MVEGEEDEVDNDGPRELQLDSFGGVAGKLLDQLRDQDIEHGKQKYHSTLAPSLRPMKPFRKFGVGDLLQNDPTMTERRRGLREVPRLYHLQESALSLSVLEFLEIFDKSLDEFFPFSPDDSKEETLLEHVLEPWDSVKEEEEEPDFILEHYPFPACLTLRSLTLSGSLDRKNRLETEDVSRLIKYLVRWLPRFEHLSICESHFPNFGVWNRSLLLLISQVFHPPLLNCMKYQQVTIVLMMVNVFVI